MKALGVRWRLTLWYGTVLATTTVCYALAVFFLMRHVLVARTDFEMEEEAAELSTEIALAADEDQLKRQLTDRFYGHEAFDFQVSRRDGSILFRSERLETGLAAPPLSASAPDIVENIAVAALGQCRLLSRHVSGKSGDFVIQCLAPLATNHANLNSLLSVLTVVGILAVATALAVGYGLASKAFAPVEQMRSLAERITANHLNQRLEVTNPNDDLGRLGQTFNRMIDRLQHSFDEMRRFTADAAHEFRTPLAILRTEAEVALRSPRGNGDLRETVEIALAETERMSRLADQLLVLCRNESGVERSAREDVPIDALLLDVVEQLQTVATSNGIRIAVGTIHPALVTGNDVELSQVFFNILNNAIRYSPRGSQIRISFEATAEQVMIRFADEGPGISAKDLPHIFERFYRVDRSRNSALGGAGLGLAICKAIVEAHDGRIAVESALGRGTVFTVTLPQVAAAG